jgi:hypothetical protein
MPVLANGYLNTSNGALGGIANAIKNSALGSVGLSGATGRLNVADMYKYGAAPNNQNVVGPQFNFMTPAANTDWRVRVSLAPGSTYFYNDPNNSLLSPLVNLPSSNSITGMSNTIASLFGAGNANRIGVVFPYTPQMQITHNANYTPQELTHSNYKSYYYNYSEVEAISINADFTVQSVDEGQYLLATIYLFRSLTKMFYGADLSPVAGSPPPIVYLNGYGQYYLPNVPCVVTKFTHTMPADVDYMDVPEPAVTQTGYNPQYVKQTLNSTRLPTTSTIVLTLQPVYSRLSQSSGFSLSDFARGALVNQSNPGNPATGFGSSQTPIYVPNKPTGGFL